MCSKVIPGEGHGDAFDDVGEHVGPGADRMPPVLDIAVFPDYLGRVYPSGVVDDEIPQGIPGGLPGASRPAQR